MNLIMFIIGTIFGSFYNVIGYRVPKKESIIYPSSHCPNCNHKLKFYELIPVLSYIFLGGKCLKCHKKISLFYPMSEIITGTLFMLSYISFGFTKELIIALTFISLLIIITISDLKYMIIPDSILIFFTIILLIEIGLIYDINTLIISIKNGIISLVFMFILKKIGDFIFKKESMGGGDIKLLGILGIVLSYPVAILSIFVGSFIGLPISLIMLTQTKNHIVPFGPFLAAGATLLFLMQIDFETIISIL